MPRSNNGGINLNRVVIYRDGADKALQTLPFDANTNATPEDLWDALGQYESETRGEVMAIPHNGNLSNGLMFDDTQFDGSTITEDWPKHGWTKSTFTKRPRSKATVRRTRPCLPTMSSLIAELGTKATWN